METVSQLMWTYDSDSKRLVHREVRYVPDFLKIVDETLKINDPNMETLKVNIDADEGTISVYNNGCGIPIEMDRYDRVYLPELIFGHLSRVFWHAEDKKITGICDGPKLINAYSHEFTIETVDL